MANSSEEEQLPYKQQVVGSNPTWPTGIYRLDAWFSGCKIVMFSGVLLGFRGTTMA